MKTILRNFVNGILTIVPITLVVYVVLSLYVFRTGILLGMC